MEDSSARLLVFNCHEPYVHQLGALGYPMDVIVGLKGHHASGWDAQMRPVPDHARLISLEEATAAPPGYACMIAHNITDLMDVKRRPEPRLLVLHSTLEGKVREEQSDTPAEEMRQMLAKYMNLVGGHAVAISRLKARSWGFVDHVVPNAVDSAEYGPYVGDIPAGLRICNFISARRTILRWDFHERAFGELPVTYVGHNPDFPGVEAAENWQQLKQLLKRHRFYIHTAEPGLEDGYNLATLEAMASGLPVLGNAHPSSPVEHGVSGYLSDDPEELAGYARRLLADRELAASLGERARTTVERSFSVQQFRDNMGEAIERARRNAPLRS